MLPLLVVAVFVVGRLWVPAAILCGLTLFGVASRAHLVERNVAGFYAPQRGTLLLIRATALLVVYLVIVYGFWVMPRITPGLAVRTGLTVASVEMVGARVGFWFGDSNAEPLEVDHVLAGTGYRFRLDRLAFLDAAIRESVELRAGSPRLSAGFESSAAGVHFAGLAAAPTFGPAMRFVCGAEFTARRIAAAVSR